MKTIVDSLNNVSKYLVEDDYPINVTANFIEMGDPSNLDLIISDLNSGNATVIEDVTEPDDWFGNKYTCSAEGVFAEIEGWFDPRVPIEEEAE
jgi:hypothetical protein